METTTEHDKLRYTKMPLTKGSGVMPALGFGTLIPDPINSKRATMAALEAGFRQFDSAERYRNEKEVEISEGIKTRQRFNLVVETGVPGMMTSQGLQIASPEDSLA